MKFTLKKEEPKDWHKFFILDPIFRANGLEIEFHWFKTAWRRHISGNRWEVKMSENGESFTIDASNWGWKL